MKPKIANRPMIGVDVGTTGAMVVLDLAGKVLCHWAFVKNHEWKPLVGQRFLTRKQLGMCMEALEAFLFSPILADLNEPFFFIEKPLPTIGRIGSISTNYLHYHLGVLHSLLSLYGTPILVENRTWKNRHWPQSNNKGKGWDKKQAHRIAYERYHEVLPINATDTGLNDAVLIGDFGRLLYLEKNGDIGAIEAFCGV